MGTTISLVNQCGIGLDIQTTVTPALDPSDWSIATSKVPPGDRPTALLQFNRDRGITHGKSWLFRSSINVDGVTLQLEEQVTGTALASTIAQSMSVSIGSRVLSSTSFQDTNDPRVISFTGESGAIYQASWAVSGPTIGFCDITYTLQLFEPASARITPVLPQIDTVIMLMLENRSLDQVLGWLYHGSAPAFVYPPGSSPNFDGIPPAASNRCKEATFRPVQGTSHFSEPCRVPAFDPYEPIEHVVKQLYADGAGNMPTGDVWSRTPTMSGFAWDYFASYEAEPSEIMGAYAAAQLPVLYGLAQSYAVSDRWFASVPTQTDPNRAFSVCGTSHGAEENDDIHADTFLTTPTVFNLLGAAGKSWGLFWQSVNPLGTGEIVHWKPYTSYYYPALNRAPNGSVQPFTQLLTMLKQGTAPNFCIVEPFWGGGPGMGADGWAGIQGNDYHPPAWVGPAEADLNALYEAICASPQWKSTLFVIMFDEHGGTWDHVPPPATISPDGKVSKSGFKFDRLGVRVPMILVSPFVRPGTVFRAPAGSAHDFDHTSFIATMLKWAGIDPAAAGMGDRVAVAPTFEEVLSNEARTDTPKFSVPAGYAQQGGGTGHLNLTLIGPGALDVRQFRSAVDQSDNGAQLSAQLQARRAKPTT